jgi:hypothetical protein
MGRLIRNDEGRVREREGRGRGELLFCYYFESIINSMFYKLQSKRKEEGRESKRKGGRCERGRKEMSSQTNLIRNILSPYLLNLVQWLHLLFSRSVWYTLLCHIYPHTGSKMAAVSLVSPAPNNVWKA